MKKLNILVLMMALSIISNAQNSDLIVTIDGDSIACKIEQVTDSVIFVRMIINNKWVKAVYKSDQIEEYKKDILYRNRFVFKEGTSIIKSIKEKPIESASLFDIPRNALTFETNIGFSSINYNRLFPLKNRTGLTFGAGINYFVFGEWFFTAESNLLLGGPKHFFETGLELYIEDEVEIAVWPGIGYRYQSLGGFLFKAFVGYQKFDEPGPMPMIAIGYSF